MNLYSQPYVLIKEVEDQHETRKEANLNLSNEDQSHPEEELGKYPSTKTHSSSSILDGVNVPCILSVMNHSSKEEYVEAGDEVNELTSALDEPENVEEEEPPKNKNKYLKRHKGKLLKKKNMYLREYSFSSDEDDRGCDS